MAKTGITIYELGDGAYIYRDTLRVRINQELEKINASRDREDFKRGYRQSLETVKYWIDSGTVVKGMDA